MATAIFGLFAVVALAAAFSVVLQQKAIHSALSLIVCLGALAFLYLQLDAQFVAILQIIIYAGAIMVLFLFVIMLLDPRADSAPGRSRRMALVAIPLGVVFVALLAGFYHRLPAEGILAAVPAKDTATMGQVENVGMELFTRYLLPFEAISILILIAILGAVVLAKRKL